jgi:hypothetical protein
MTTASASAMLGCTTTTGEAMPFRDKVALITAAGACVQKHRLGALKAYVGRAGTRPANARSHV